MLNTPRQAHLNILGWRHWRLILIFVILSVLWCIASLKKTSEHVLRCWDHSTPLRLISPWRLFSMSLKKSFSCLSKKLYDSLRFEKLTSVPSSKRTMMVSPSEMLLLHYWILRLTICTIEGLRTLKEKSLKKHSLNSVSLLIFNFLPWIVKMTFYGLFFVANWLNCCTFFEKLMKPQKI